MNSCEDMDSFTRNYLGADFFFFISHCTSIFFTIDFTCTWMLASSIYPYFLFNFTCTNLVITCSLRSCTHACATYLSACKWMTNIYSLCPKKLVILGFKILGFKICSMSLYPFKKCTCEYKKTIAAKYE